MYEQLENQTWQSLLSEMKNLSGKLKTSSCKTAHIRAKP